KVINSREDSTEIEYNSTTFRVSKVTNGDGAFWSLTPYLADGLSGSQSGVTGKVRKPATGSIGNLAQASENDFVETYATYVAPRASEEDSEVKWFYQTDRYGLVTAKAAPPTIEYHVESAPPASQFPAPDIYQNPGRPTDVWKWQRDDHGLVTKVTEPAG